MDEQEKRKWKRPALEAYVNVKDRWYHNRAMIELKKIKKETTGQIILGTVVSITVSSCLIFSLLRKSSGA